MILKCSIQWYLVHYVVQLSPLPSFKTSVPSQKKILYPLSGHSSFHLPPVSKKHWLSLSMDLSILEVSYKWNQIISDFLYPASFTYNNIFKVPSYCRMYQYFIIFYDWIIHHYMKTQHFVYLFISWWTFVLFPLLGNYKYCYYKY